MEKKNSNEKNGKNIRMKIFIIFFVIIIILFSLKIKFYIDLNADKLNMDLKLKIWFFEIKRKGALIKRKRKFAKTKSNKNQKSKIKLKDIKNMLQYIEIEKLSINAQIGLLFLFPTAFSVPVASIIIDSIKLLPLKKIKNFSYEILPQYDKFEFKANVNLIFKIRVIDILKIYITIQTQKN